MVKERDEGNEEEGVVGKRVEEKDATGGTRNKEQGRGSGGVTRVVPTPTQPTRTSLVVRSAGVPLKTSPKSTLSSLSTM